GPVPPHLLLPGRLRPDLRAVLRLPERPAAPGHGRRERVPFRLERPDHRVVQPASPEGAPPGRVLTWLSQRMGSVAWSVGRTARGAAGVGDGVDGRSDAALLLASRDDPAAFVELYRRHAEDLLRYFARRTLDPEAAAELTAETFAEAFASRARYRYVDG